MVASKGGHVDAVRALVELGAAVNQADVRCVYADGLCASRGPLVHVVWIERVWVCAEMWMRARVHETRDRGEEDTRGYGLCGAGEGCG